MKHTISEIEKLYPDWYKPDFDLTLGDQQFIWENTPFTEEDENKLKELKVKRDANVIHNGSAIGICKDTKKIPEKQIKILAIKNLQKSRVNTTSLKDIASWLKDLFGIWTEKPLHWLFIAEHYTPKAINSVINEMQKRKSGGAMPLDNPGAYFTKVLRRYHPLKKVRKRKEFTDTNGDSKPTNETNL